MPRSRSLLLFALLVLGWGMLLAPGCRAGGRQSVAPLTPRERGTLTIRVENLQFNDVTLHALAAGSRIRLGTVAGKGVGRFTIPWTTLTELRFEIDLLAGPSFTTRYISVNPGEVVEVVVQEPLERTIIRR